MSTQSETNEKPKKQFKGWFIPAKIVQLIEDGKINAKETLLLAMIDGLVTPNKGCFASNEYLAEHLHLSCDLVSHMITKLKKMKLITQIGFNGRIRYLETVLTPIDGEKAIPFLKSRIDEVRKNAPKQTRGNALVGLGETPDTDQGKRPSPNRETSLEVNLKKSKGTLPRAPSEPPVKSRKSKRYTTPKTKLHKSKWTEWDEARGLELKQIMAEQDTDLVGHIYMTDEVFTENIYKVRTERKRSQAQIEEVLEWYRRNYTDAYTPKLHRMYEFAAKFGSIVEAMERQRGGGKSQSEEDAWREAEGEFEHHYYTMFPEHDHMLMENQNMVCEKLGLPPRFRYDESNNTWSEIPK